MHYKTQCETHCRPQCEAQCETHMRNAMHERTYGRTNERSFVTFKFKTYVSNARARAKKNFHDREEKR